MQSVLLLFTLISITQAQHSNEEVIFPIDQLLFNTEKYDAHVDIFKICDETLGCIETDSKWYHKEYRPINLRPLARHILKTEFLLIKKHQTHQDELVYDSIIAKESSIKEAGFRNDSEIMILIHDFTGNGYTGWVKHLANTVFTRAMDINIISVDWQRGAEAPYDQAISNARVVALEITVLLKELQEKFNYSLENVHIVGHGVGAHIAGYVGATYNKIKKITGLDPSGPRFEGMPSFVKLNPKSAKYVEVIHTDYYDSRSQGINETLGHSDFFINGARKQPGCPENTTFTNVLSLERTSLKQGEILPGCSHKRAFKYFIEALVNKGCSFQGVRCGSLENFENGMCVSCNTSDHDCRIFGLKTYSDTSEGNKFFLNTAASYPYCMLEYRISVFIKEEEKYGYFSFILVDESANIAEASLSTNEIENFRVFKKEHNNTYIYFAHPPHLTNIKEAKIKWTEKNKIYCFIFCKLTITVENVTVAFLGTGNDDGSENIVLCPPEGKAEIESGSYVTFTVCTEKTESINVPLTSFNKSSTESTQEDKSTSHEIISEIKITTSPSETIVKITKNKKEDTKISSLASVVMKDKSSTKP